MVQLFVWSTLCAGPVDPVKIRHCCVTATQQLVSVVSFVLGSKIVNGVTISEQAYVHMCT